MFEDPRSRALWRHYELRARYALAATTAGVRRELLEDLSAHVRDALIANADGSPEHDRLKTILTRLGEPEEYLAPLLAEAVLRRPGPSNAFAASADAISAAWRLGVGVLAIAIAYPLIALLALGTSTLAVMRIALPQTAGVFALSADEYQVRVLGGSALGDQVMPVWLAVLLLPVCVAIILWAIGRARALALSIAYGNAPS